jgi:hypothetical protein
MKKLYDLILQNAGFYDAPMSESKLKLFASELAAIPLQELEKAFSIFRNEPGRRLLPMPADIKKILSAGEMSGDYIAIEAASKIVEAMSKFGWTNPEKAKEFMGAIAWEVVKREGGWAALCERTNNDDLPILRAQLRELAKVVAIRQKQESNLNREQLEQKQTKLLEDKK